MPSVNKCVLTNILTTDLGLVGFWTVMAAFAEIE
ncbi:hypothetical protein Thiowin_02072 [Thiorhodovibrio winogradskyi]|uniref:Uncharacterized protein n=1 Tax=Thiorhodovibrio winogradskyi TaxID=77007 RepID=A0ABZ0S9X6_9GAMM